MGMTNLTVKLINQPGSTGRGSIVGTDDQRLGVFSEKVGLFEVGRTYEVEYIETARNGRTLRNVKNAKQVAGAPASEPFVSGAYRPPPALQPAPPAVPFRTPEQLFVQGLAEAYIASGRCANPGELKETVTKLREVWRQTFGFDDRVFTPGEAGKPRLVAAE
jgi:hypothetical protein